MINQNKTQEIKELEERLNKLTKERKFINKILNGDKLI